MVFGWADASTCAPSVTQCADTTHTALGFGSRALRPCSASVNALCSMAFIGDPWPTNKTGIFPNTSLPARAATRALRFTLILFNYLISNKNKRIRRDVSVRGATVNQTCRGCRRSGIAARGKVRSEEHTSELQSL